MVFGISCRFLNRLSPPPPTQTHAHYLHQPARLITMPKAAYLKYLSFLYLKASKKKGFISSLCRSKPVALEDRHCDIDPHRFFDFDVLAKTLRNHNFKTRTNYFKFSFFNCSITDWNSIPSNVMHAPSPIYWSLLDHLCQF